ncbi:MAG: PH domain-containing protein [Syntrophomonadaceae bacterium]|nr:PH domain-containing protein [Syntrophomonadaceae bacterium]
MNPLAAWRGNALFKGTGWQLNGSKLLLRSRILGRVTAIVHRWRIQSLDVSHALGERLYCKQYADNKV